MRLTPQELLQRLKIGEGAHAYHLGCVKFQRVTLLSQQNRALNLAWAANEVGLVTDATRVLIVGAGAAGLTAALGFARLGARVTVLEREEVLVPRFSGCTERYLHPHAYDWPAAGSHRLQAGLPLMDWTAATANAVARQLRRAWTVDRAGARSLDVRLGCRVTAVDLDERYLEATTCEQHRLQYDLLVVAIGVGTEPRHASTPRYWENDPLSQDTVGGPRSILVSGTGDGGLTDVVRASLLDFDHAQLMMHVLSLAERASLVEEVRAVERRASEDPTFDLDDAFRQLQLGGIEQYVTDRRRSQRDVTLNFNGPRMFLANTMALNRLIMECLRRRGLKQWKGCVAKCEPAENGWSVFLDTGETRAFDLALLRWGPTKDFASLFPAVSITVGEVAPAADATRHAAWPQGYFERRGRRNESPRTPQRFDVVPLEEGFGLDSRVLWMSNAGTVVGWTQLFNRGDYTYFVWSGSGVPPALGELPGLSRTAATSINDRGEYVVQSSFGVDGPLSAAFLVGRNGVQGLGRGTGGHSLNNSGHVVGWAVDAENRIRPARWQDGSMAFLKDAGHGGVALRINDAGVVVGELRLIHDGPSAGARWLDGKLELYRPPPPYHSVRCLGLNAFGDATGHLTRNGGQSDFFIWLVGEKPRILGEGEGYGINDERWIVGRAGIRGMFMWHQETMFWFSDMIDPAWKLCEVQCVTNDLRICGVAKRSEIDRAILLVPRLGPLPGE